MPGAETVSIDDNKRLDPMPEVGGRLDFAHLLPDGSLHLALPHHLANEVVNRNWGEFGVDAGQGDRHFPVYLLIYTPFDNGELEVVWEIVRAGFEAATGILVEGFLSRDEKEEKWIN